MPSQGWPTGMAHFFAPRNGSLGEGGALAAVVRGIPETPHRTRDSTDFPRALRKSEARLPLARAATAWRTGGVLVVGATPPFWPLMRHRGGVNGPR